MRVASAVLLCLALAFVAYAASEEDWNGFFTDNYGYGRGMYACNRGQFFTAIYSEVGFMIGRIRSDQNVFGRWYEPGVFFNSTSPNDDCLYGNFQISLQFSDNDDDSTDDDVDSFVDDDSEVVTGFEGFYTCGDDDSIRFPMNELLVASLNPSVYQCGAVDVADFSQTIQDQWEGGFDTRWSVCLEDDTNVLGEPVYSSSFDALDASSNFYNPIFGSAVGLVFENGKVGSGRWVDNDGLKAIDLTIALENGELEQLWWATDDDFDVIFNNRQFGASHRTLIYAADDDDSTTARVSECEKHVNEFFPSFFSSLTAYETPVTSRPPSPSSSSSASALAPLGIAASAVLLALF